MDIITLASGSEGNCTLIRTKETAVLVDIGISCRRTTAFLKEVGVSPDEISAIFVTHEHIDHVKGIPLFSKKYNIKVAAIKDIWRFNLLSVPEHLRVDIRRRMRLNDMEIEAFETAHDTLYPLGFTFFDGKHKVGVATDTGYVTAAMAQSLENVNCLLIEANHDENMLMKGSYPYHLKQRILSKKGHLSNNDCGEFLAMRASKGTKIILGHLSEENNTPEVALNTVRSKLARYNKADFCKIYTAPRLAPSLYA